MENLTSKQEDDLLEAGQEDYYEQADRNISNILNPRSKYKKIQEAILNTIQ